MGVSAIADSRPLGLDKKANRIAREPNSAPIAPQKTGVAAAQFGDRVAGDDR